MPSLDSMTVEEQVSYVTKGCVDVVREVELRKKTATSDNGAKAPSRKSWV